jgi:hypothetical protein
LGAAAARDYLNSYLVSDVIGAIAASSGQSDIELNAFCGFFVNGQRCSRSIRHHRMRAVSAFIPGGTGTASKQIRNEKDVP